MGLRKCSNNGNKSKPDFYVGPDGPSATMRATAYRFVRYKNDDGSLNEWGQKLLSDKSALFTYFGFDEFNSGKATRDAFQIKGIDKVNPLNPEDMSWSDGRLRGQFDTLQLFENGIPQVRHPTMFGNEPGKPLEPFTKAYPRYGKGGVEKLYADKRVINFDDVNILPEE